MLPIPTSIPAEMSVRVNADGSTSPLIPGNSKPAQDPLTTLAGKALAAFSLNNRSKSLDDRASDVDHEEVLLEGDEGSDYFPEIDDEGPSWTSRIVELRELASVQQSANDWGGAEECWDRVLQLDSKDKTALEGKANCFQKRKDFVQAEKYWDKVLQLDPKFKTALESKARCCRKRGDFERAQHFYKLLRQLDPDYKPILLPLAKCYLMLERLQQAQELSQVLLEKEPENYRAFAMKLQCKREQGQLLSDQELNWLKSKAGIFENELGQEKKLSLTKDYLIAEHHRFQHRWDEAIQRYRQMQSRSSYQKSPPVVQKLVVRGEEECQLKREQLRAASQPAASPSQISTRKPGETLQGAETQLKEALDSREYDAALQLTCSLLEADPQNPELFWFQYRSLRGLKKAKRALECLAQLQVILERQTNSAGQVKKIMEEQLRIRFEEAECKRRLQKWEEALTSYQQALALDSVHTPLELKIKMLGGQAKCHQRLGVNGQARECWDKALKVCLDAEKEFPGAAQAGMAWIYKQKGDWATACDFYLKTVRFHERDRAFLFSFAECSSTAWFL